jgi:alpha-L-fucosidase
MPKRIDWFLDARYGMFLHWGLYSLLGRGEWVRNRERFADDDYRRLADRFNPTKYDPRAWARLARRAGMKYMVLTTKHHDGFCLWDSNLTDFTAPKTRAGRDLVAEYAEACRAEGLKVGFYFSLVDWNRDDICEDPRWKWCSGGEMRQIGIELPLELSDSFVDFMHGQVRELLTGYGKVDILWFDGNWISDAAGYRTEPLVRMARRAQPGILVNDRAKACWDFRTTEQHIKGLDEPWEACMTLNQSWGWDANDRNYKSPMEVVNMLGRCGYRGGNLLLNVGPKPDGTIGARERKILEEVGEWIDTNGEALYGTRRSPLGFQHAGFTSAKEGALYMIVQRWPGTELTVTGLKNRVTGVSLLSPKTRLTFTQDANHIYIEGLPRTNPDRLGTVVKVHCKGWPRWGIA